jgi:hypothetical protein
MVLPKLALLLLRRVGGQGEKSTDTMYRKRETDSADTLVYASIANNYNCNGSSCSHSTAQSKSSFENII